MKIITVISQRVSPEALSAALPAEGIGAVTVSQTQSFSRMLHWAHRPRTV